MNNKNILKEMIKEEARLHTTLYGGVSFYYFPLLILVISVFISYVFFSISQDIETGFILNATLTLFFLTGMMNGAFGIYAKDYLEKRFGDIGRLFSNLTILPVPLKNIFVLTIIKDITFYLIWLVIPIYIGYSLVALLNHIAILEIVKIFISIFASFIYGVLTAFLLSILYEKYLKTFISVMTAFFIFFLYAYISGLNYTKLLLPLTLYNSFDLLTFLIIIVSYVLITMLIIYLIGEEFKTRIKKEKVKSSRIFRNKNYDLFLLKDYIDLKRTGGLFAKPFFTMFIPSLLLLLLFIQTPYFSIEDKDILLFSILLGTLSVALFNSMLSSDSFSYYKFLPVEIDDYIKSKIKMTLMLGTVYGLITLLIFGAYENTFYFIIHAYIIYLIYMLYNLGLTFYFAGLNPQEYLLNSVVFIKYSLALVPVLFIGMISAVFITSIIFYIIGLLIFAGITYVLFKKGFNKWRYSEEVK